LETGKCKKEREKVVPPWEIRLRETVVARWEDCAQRKENSGRQRVGEEGVWWLLGGGGGGGVAVKEAVGLWQHRAAGKWVETGLRKKSSGSVMRGSIMRQKRGNRPLLLGGHAAKAALHVRVKNRAVMGKRSDQKKQKKKRWANLLVLRLGKLGAH